MAKRKSRQKGSSRFNEFVNHPFVKAHTAASHLLRLLWRIKQLPSLPVPPEYGGPVWQWERDNPDWDKWENAHIWGDQFPYHIGKKSIEDVAGECHKTMKDLWNILAAQGDPVRLPGWSIRAAAASGRAWANISLPFWPSVIQKNLPNFCAAVARDPAHFDAFRTAVRDMERCRGELAIAFGSVYSRPQIPEHISGQLREFEYAVLLTLSQSKIAMTIEDIAGRPRCPKSEKTTRTIIKKLVALGYAKRPARYGIVITESGKAALI